MGGRVIAARPSGSGAAGGGSYRPRRGLTNRLDNCTAEAAGPSQVGTQGGRREYGVAVLRRGRLTTDLVFAHCLPAVAGLTSWIPKYC